MLHETLNVGFRLDTSMLEFSRCTYCVMFCSRVTVRGITVSIKYLS